MNCSKTNSTLDVSTDFLPGQVYVADLMGLAPKDDKVYYIKVLDVLKPFGTREKYDIYRFITNLQGLINREKPILFAEFFTDTDTFWFKFITSKDKMLDGKEIVYINTIDDLLDIFDAQIKSLGLVIWDRYLPATANVATTICGVSGYLPVRYVDEIGGFYNILIKRGYEVKLSLVDKFNGKDVIYGTTRNSTGSKKCDAYIFALENYMEYTNDSILAYYMDAAGWQSFENYPDLGNAFIPNLDYVVANNVFVFDLSPWEDEVPCDDLEQALGTDLTVFKEIMQAHYDKNKGLKITTVVGFTPWHQKYTEHAHKGKHGAVATEWVHAEILSAYNCIMDADAAGLCGLGNASLYRLYPLKETYKNTIPSKGETYDPNKKYVLFYMGDYDSAAWLTTTVPRLFTDPARGKVPMMWGFNPNLSDRVPMVFDYVYENKTPFDYFVFGDSGAGYLNPTLLNTPRLHSNNPSGMQVWIDHNKKYGEKFDLGIVGFLLNGRFVIDDSIMEAYSQFATIGAVHYTHNQKPKIINGSVFVSIISDSSNIGTPKNEAVQNVIGSTANASSSGNFYAYRTILNDPSYINEVMNELISSQPEFNFAFPDPNTFFDLVKQSIS